MDGELDMGHARALLAVERAAQVQLGTRSSRTAFSARNRGAGTRRGRVEANARHKAPARTGDIVRLEDELADTLGAGRAASGRSEGRAN